MGGSRKRAAAAAVTPDAETAPNRAAPAGEMRLPGAEAHRIGRRAAAVRPREACGVLLGERAAEGVTVHRAAFCRNIDPDPERRYELHPRDFLRWDRAAARRGWEVVGIWHSHPDGGPSPSATDRERAWRGWDYLIAAAGPGGAIALKCWRPRGEGWVEVPLTPR